VAQSVNVMVDSTKFHAPALFRVCGLNRVTRVITDSKMGGEVRQRLESMGVEVLVAIPEETPGLAQAQ
jgi:DeoR/GlpR family transcriptional regulator of sugar metabolism